MQAEGSSTANPTPIKESGKQDETNMEENPETLKTEEEQKVDPMKIEPITADPGPSAPVETMETTTNGTGSMDKQDATTTALENEIIDLEEKRRKDCLGNMEKIEKEFADLKEKFFNDKIETLRKEYETIKSGTHQGFLKKVKELEDIKQHKVWAAEKWRDYQIQNIMNIFEAETRQAEEEYKIDKRAMREKMMNTALEKKKKLLEEKSTMNLTDAGERIMTRTLRKRGAGAKDVKEGTSFKRRLNPPHINYTLKENEILEDLSLIQKAHPTYGKWGAKNSLEVYADRGRLYYHNQVFEKGKDVFIEAKHENGKWHGTIVLVSPSEIHIKSQDNIKSRFSLAQLRSGRYTLTHLHD